MGVDSGNHPLTTLLTVAKNDLRKPDEMYGLSDARHGLMCGVCHLHRQPSLGLQLPLGTDITSQTRVQASLLEVQEHHKSILLNLCLTSFSSEFLNSPAPKFYSDILIIY